MTNKISTEIFEWVKSLSLAIIIALLIRGFVIEVFLVEGESMAPTLRNSERLVVNKFVYHLREPERGEIVVFEYSDNKDFIKRIVGFPGEQVEIIDGQVYIDGEQYERDYPINKTDENYGPKQVPPDHYFVLGDNRDNSMDSRSPSVGFVMTHDIKGKAFVIFWPLDKVELLH